MRIPICSTQDPEARELLGYAQRSGQIPYIDRISKTSRDQWYFIDVLTGGNVYRAPDAIFRQMPDGLYIFKDGVLYYEEQV